MLKRISSFHWVHGLFVLAITLTPLLAMADEAPQQAPAIPEPSSWLVFGLGALGVGWAFKRRGRP